MNDNMLNDLASKIKNIVHDFELEYDLPIRVGVSVEATRIVIETQMAESRPVSAMEAYDRPLLDEPAQDTDQMITTHDPLAEMAETGRMNTADVPARSWSDALPRLNESAQDTDQMETPLTTSRAGYQYDDAPGQVFASPEEHAAWQRQQNRRSRG